MKTDANKGITGIAYNHLNLPTTVTFSGTNKKIDYFYNAVGTKLKKIVTDGGSLITTEYSGNYVYENGVLQFFNTAEGYVEPKGTGWEYVYQYKDHLGNVRLSYADADGNGLIAQTEIREENNYYPFGLKHKGYNFVVNGRDHKYGFGNKEEQGELGLGWIDITARNYDPALGRWMNLDPLAEQMRRHSPYNYAFDNPVYFIDPDGMMGFPSIRSIFSGAKESFNKIKNEAEKIVSNVKETVVKKATEIKENVSGTIKNAKEFVKQTAQKTTETIKQTVNDTKEGVKTALKEGQQFVKDNKEQILNVANNIQDAGDGFAIAGYGAAVVGAPIAGVGAAPGATVAAFGNGLALLGSGIEIATNLIAGDNGAAGLEAGFVAGGMVIDAVVDRVLPGPTPDISKEATTILKEGINVKTILTERAIKNSLEEKK